MRKRVLLALMLVVALVLTTGCSLIVKDPEVDKQTVIIEVCGKSFTKGDIAADVDYQLSYMEYFYNMNGMQFDKTDAESVSDARESVIEALIRQTVVNSKAAELGMDQFTDEELQALQDEVDTTYQSYVDSITSSYFADTELTGDELTAAVEAKMAELGYPTKDAMLESEKTAKATEKLKEHVVKDVAVTDEEIKARYDELVSNAMNSYATNLSAYGTDVSDGKTIYYTPAGYRYVKNILIKFTEDDQTAIDDLNGQLSDKQSQLTNVQTALAELGEAPAADAETPESEGDAKQRADLTATEETLNAEIAELNTKLDAAKAAAYAAIQPKIDEILAKLAEGGDFAALMEEYGEDPGMKTSPAKENGYLVSAESTNWVAPFTEASMALKAIGDVSPAVKSDFGIHLIQYVSDAADGSTPLDDVKDEISAELTTKAQDALYDETVQTWVTEADAKVYRDRLAD